MKNLVLILFIPLFSFSQGDFRKMNWGESYANLKEKYPDIDFDKDKFDDKDVYTHDDIVGLVEANVQYYFHNDKLIVGQYVFRAYDIFRSEKDHLEDFYTISKILNRKYEMIREDKWVDPNDYWKDKPGELDYALSQDLVEVEEKSEDGLIQHYVQKEDGQITHRLTYFSGDFYNQNKTEEDEDF